MYAKLSYFPGATATVQADLLADIVAIVTGTTDVNTLSATCDKANTTITADIAAGWTLHDAAAGTNAKCVKSALADDPATFKFVVIDTNTNNRVYTGVYETWDDTAHSGTNMCQYSMTSSYGQQVSATNGGIVHIFATPRMLMIVSQIGSTWGSSTNTGGCGCFERTRACPWDTVAAGYPPYLFGNFGYWATNNTSGCAPRKLLRTGIVNTGSSALMDAYAIPFGTVSSTFSSLNGADQKVQNTSGVGLIPLLPITMCDPTAMPIQYGEISSLCDFWMIPQGVAANLDTIVVNSINYLVLQASGTTKLFACRKG